MATLTTSWVSYATASFSSGSATIKFYLEAKYSSQSVANNTTAVQTRLRSAFTSGNNLSGAGYKFTCTYANTVSGSGTWYFSNEVITSGSTTVTHNNDGTKSITIKATAYNKYWNFTKNMSATVSLPTIQRLAKIVSGTDFNDEGNPTITFTNPGGMNIQPYLNWIDNSGTRVYQILGGVGKYNSPATWNLTNEQRTAVRNATNNQSSYKVMEGVQTYNGSTLISGSASSVAKTFTFVNAEPTITMTREEKNQDVINLLGGSGAGTIILNASRLKVTATPTTYKNATVSKVNFSGFINGSVTTSPYQFEADVGDVSQDNRYIEATVIDSRGFSATIRNTPLSITTIPYQKVKQNSFSFQRLNPTSDDVVLSIDSVYYQQTFGSNVNAPTVKYKIGEQGSWITIPSSEYTIDTTNNNLSVDYTITNAIDYRDTDIFYVEVSDLLSSWTNSYRIAKGIPVMEWGEDDVKVNGDLYLADADGENEINVRDAITGIDGLVYTENVLLASNLTVNANSNTNTATKTLTPASGYSPIMATLDNVWNGVINLWYCEVNSTNNTIKWRCRNVSSSNATGISIYVTVLYIKTEAIV